MSDDRKCIGRLFGLPMYEADLSEELGPPGVIYMAPWPMPQEEVKVQIPLTEVDGGGL